MKQKVFARPFLAWEDCADSVPVTIFLPSDIAKIFDELHDKIPADGQAEAELVLNKQIGWALLQYHSIMGLRTIGCDTSSLEKPHLELVR